MSYYQKNLTRLRELTPAYAQWVESGPADPKFELLLGPTGMANLRVRLEGRPDFLLYDPDDPLHREREAAAQLPPIAGQATILFGLGLGYRLSALLDRKPAGHVLFLVEESPALVRSALMVMDFTAELTAGDLIFIVPEAQLWEKMSTDMARFYRRGQAGLLVDDNCRLYFSPSFATKIERFQLKVRSQAQNEAAYIKNIASVVENELVNLPLILLSPRLSDLEGTLAGVPAIIVSAGPSLAENVHLLTEAAGKAAIIATAPVLRVLLAHEVTPDLVGTLDYTPGNQDVLAEAYTAEDIPLVFLEGVWPQVIRDYQGELISVLTSEGPVQKWLAPWLGAQKSWPVAGDVGSFCVNLAVYLGADPIILVGQDLAFPESATHGEGVVGRRHIPSAQTVDNPIWLESVDGGRVLSNLTLASYLQGLTEIISRTPRTFINTSSKGARIKGARELSLAEAIKLFCIAEHDVTTATRRAIKRPQPDLTGVMSELAGIETELEALEIVTAKALEINQDILIRAEKPEADHDPSLRHLLNVHAQYFRGVKSYWQAFSPLETYLTPTLADLEADGTDSQQPETLRLSMTRDHQVMTAAHQAALRLRTLIGQARQELIALAEALQSVQVQPNSSKNHFAAAQAWAQLGRLKNAWSHYRTALTIDPENDDLIIEAAKTCLKRERPRTARGIVGRWIREESGRPKAEEFMRLAEATRRDWLDRAESHLAENDWVTALLLAGKALANDPGDPIARDIADKARAKRDARVIEAQRKNLLVIRRQENHERLKLAADAFAAGRHQEVIDLLADRLDVALEDDHEGLVLLGASLADRGRSEEGLTLLKAVQDRRPEWAFVAAKLGPVLIKNGFWGPGLEMMERAGRVEATYGALLFEAGCHRLTAGDFEQAGADFQAFLAGNPYSYEALNKLAICHLAQGRPDVAKTFFQKSLDMKPDGQTARLGLARCLDPESPAADRLERRN